MKDIDSLRAQPNAIDSICLARAPILGICPQRMDLRQLSSLHFGFFYNRRAGNAAFFSCRFGGHHSIMSGFSEFYCAFMSLDSADFTMYAEDELMDPETEGSSTILRCTRTMF